MINEEKFKLRHNKSLEMMLKDTYFFVSNKKREMYELIDSALDSRVVFAPEYFIHRIL